MHLPILCLYLDAECPLANRILTDVWLQNLSKLCGRLKIILIIKKVQSVDINVPMVLNTVLNTLALILKFKPDIGFKLLYQIRFNKEVSLKSIYKVLLKENLLYELFAITLLWRINHCILILRSGFNIDKSLLVYAHCTKSLNKKTIYMYLFRMNKFLFIIFIKRCGIKLHVRWNFLSFYTHYQSSPSHYVSWITVLKKSHSGTYQIINKNVFILKRYTVILNWCQSCISFFNSQIVVSSYLAYSVFPPHPHQTSHSQDQSIVDLTLIQLPQSGVQITSLFNKWLRISTQAL